MVQPLAARRSTLLGALVLALSAAPAVANVPAPKTVTLPVKAAASLGGFTVGSASMTVTYTDGDATADVTAPSVGLAANQVFHIETCIKAHLLNRSYATTCEQRVVDTTGNAASITVAATPAHTTMPRPAAGASGYFSFDVAVRSRQSDGSYKEVASSWPSTGLAGASVGVPSVGAITAPVPASEGVAVSSRATGGVNTGYPDSMCQGFQYPAPAAPGPGVSTSALGTDAPAYYEVGDPTGDYAGQAPKGTMLIIHGGGWFMNGPAMVSTERSEADQWRADGWRTLSLSYRPCNQSFEDVKWFYDQARAQWGATGPYCALGGSAGGNLALMLAAARSTVDCVVAEAGPTDAATLRTGSTPAGGTDGPRWVYNLLTTAVGPESLFWWSPAQFPIKARVLWATAANDPYIPQAQGTLLASKMRAANASAYVDVMSLPAGTTPWVHANVSDAGLATFRDHERQLVAPLVG